LRNGPVLAIAQVEDFALKLRELFTVGKAILPNCRLRPMTPFDTVCAALQQRSEIRVPVQAD